MSEIVRLARQSMMKTIEGVRLKLPAIGIISQKSERSLSIEANIVY